MPRYEIRGIQVPFYGLQEVYPIKLEPGTTMQRVLGICQEHCESDHFVLIDEYHPIEKHFLVGAAMSVEAGIQTCDGYTIYAKKPQRAG